LTKKQVSLYPNLGVVPKKGGSAKEPNKKGQAYKARVKGVEIGQKAPKFFKLKFPANSRKGGGGRSLQETSIVTA